MPVAVHQLTDIFAVLKPDLKLQPVPVTPTFYQDIDREFSGFGGHVLIALHEFTEDWPTWETHPAGDEMVVLLSGEVTFVVKTASGEEQTTLSESGTYVIVPIGAWHTARIAENARMLFITPGEGTENREEYAI